MSAGMKIRLESSDYHKGAKILKPKKQSHQTDRHISTWTAAAYSVTGFGH